MAYIGRGLDKISNVEVLDNITFDGSSSYTLQKNSVNFTPSSANTLLLSIDGVVQAGNFTVSGSTIDFGTAVAGTSTCDFVLHYGVGLITTPSDGSVTEAKLGTGAVTSTKLASGAVPNQSAFKNIIINGSMDIAQRGTSHTTASGYTLDRFTWTDDSTSAFTITQSTDVPSGQGFATSMKFDCTTANGSLGSSDQIRQVQQIEGQNLQYLKYGTSSAESLTCSFWVKSNKTGIYCVTLSQPDDSYAANTLEYTISSADTWEKKTVTFSGDTGGVINNDNGAGLWLMFAFGAGSGRHMTANQWNSSYGLSTSNQVNLADSTSNELYLTGVQLEAGTSASDFEFLPYDVNLNRCLRYYYKHSPTGAIYAPYTSNDAYNCYWNNFPMPMRAAPTCTETSGLGWSMGNSTKYNWAGSRSSAGNYLPPTYNADAEL